MTWLLRICSSLLLTSISIAATVSGTVELTGSQVPAVKRQRNYSGVVVWLEPATPGPAPVPRHAEMIQKDKTFQPHVLAIPLGSSVDFPNHDPIFHNAFSNYSGQLFDVSLYPPGSTRKVVFKREGVVRVFCNIHQSMSAVIVVLRSPYFAVSHKEGSWSIPDVPPGTYTMHVYHERATDATLNSLVRKITVIGSEITEPPMTISETGYVQTPHTNKFGKQYPEAPDDASTYPGAKK